MKTSVTVIAALLASAAILSAQTITGKAAFADYSQQKPGVSRKITVADLPEPNPAEAVDNGARVIARPEGMLPIAPPGFKVTIYAGGDGGPTPAPDGHYSERLGTFIPKGTFQQPRIVRTAPNGDIFLSDSFVGKVYVLRGLRPDGHAETISLYAEGLSGPFGIAFYPAANPKWVYVANTFTVVRFPYKAGDLVASGAPETIVSDLPGFAQLRGGGHWTRDVVFTPDESHMLISVGSASNADNADDHPNEFHRATCWSSPPRASRGGLRQRHPQLRRRGHQPVTGALWCSTQRARQPGQQPRSRLHHVCEGGRDSTAGPGTTWAAIATPGSTCPAPTGLPSIRI